MPTRRQSLLRLAAAGLPAWCGRVSAAAPVPPAPRWQCSPPLLAPADRPADPCHAVKDPTVVQSGNRWHIFATIRSRTRTHQIEHIAFDRWGSLANAERTVLSFCDGYFCAPQVFWFSPWRKWILLHQTAIPGRPVELQPAISVADRLDQPAAWSKAMPVFREHPAGVARWIDFWMVADDERTHLFFTSLDGKMWRCSARLADFPHGWDAPGVALQADIFEASHTYRLLGQDRFLTIVEAQGPGGRRYYKSYLADRLDGAWQPGSATWEQPFAGPANVRPSMPAWTDSYSHGELLRCGINERMEIDPARLRFLIQGVADADRQGKPYSAIPWKLGLLTAV